MIFHLFYPTSVKIDKVSIVLKELNIEDLKNISTVIKPSNFKNLIVNKLKNGKLSTQIEFYLDQNNKLKNFIAKEKVIDLKSEISNNLFFEKLNLNFSRIIQIFLLKIYLES